MEDIFSNKYMLLLIGLLIFIGSIVIGVSVLSKDEDEKEEKKISRTYQYQMYIKSDSIIKFNFESSYDECTDIHGKKYACGNYSDKITSFEIVNHDESIYSSFNFNGRNVVESLIAIVDISIKNNIQDKSLKIITNYEFNYKEISEEIRKKFNYGSEFSVVGITRKNLVEEDIIKELGSNTDIPTFKVIFDSTGGSLVAEQEIVQNELLIQPVAPLRDGYVFKEWQLNGQRFDFNLPITEDITLYAIWELVKNVEDNKTTSTTTTTTKRVDEEGKPQTTTTSTTTKKTVTEENSTMDKMNLNDQIMVYTENATTNCGYYYFSKGLDDNGDIIYDIEKENKVKDDLEKIQNNLPKGIKNFSYNLDEHKLYLNYTALIINNRYNYTNLYTSWRNDLKRLTDIWSDASYTGAGVCSNQKGKTTQLNESICKDYNLNCSRW